MIYRLKRYEEELRNELVDYILKFFNPKIPCSRISSGKIQRREKWLR